MRIDAANWVISLAIACVSLASAASGQCERAKLTHPAAAADDLFGFSTGLSGNRMVIGASLDDVPQANYGSVWVYEGGGADWSLIPAPTWSAGPNLFGFAADIDGDTLAVALSWNYRQVHAYRWDGAGWVDEATLQPTGSVQPDGFTQTLDVDGDRILVGAHNDQVQTGFGGAAYLFERDPNGVWAQAAQLLPADPCNNCAFGWSVALDGDRAVIGVFNDDDLGNFAGSAYVFERQSFGKFIVWAQVAKLLPSDGSVFWHFGQSVAISGDRVIVGAYSAHLGAPGGGEAYIYERDPNGLWAEVAALIPNDIANSDQFGRSVAIEGDLALVGAENSDFNGISSGAVYVYHRQPSGQWVNIAKLAPSDGQYNQEFGNRVVLDGQTALIGSYGDDIGGAVDAGSAYVFSVSPDHNGNGVMDVCECPGDLDADNDVDISDLATQLSNYGAASGATPSDGDLDLDQDIDITDLSLLLAVFGVVCG